MGLQKEIWQRVIKQQLFKENKFLSRMKNVDKHVDGKIIHIPQAGAPSAVQVNRTVFPATATQRTDTELVYEVNEFTTDPRFVLDRDMTELSYNKIASIMEEDGQTMYEKVADYVLYEMVRNLPAASLVASTGADSAATATGATGTRKIITEKDFLRAKTLMNLQNVSMSNRTVVMPSNMIEQLQSDTNLKYAFQKVVDLKEGVIGRLHGFDIMERSRVITLSGAQAVKAPGAATAVTDTEAAIFFEKNSVERGLGAIKMFADMNKPEYYGSMISFLLRMGARANRADNKGVIALYGAV
jgi:hypothetical protein